MSLLSTLHREQPNCASPCSNFLLWSYLNIYEFPKIINRCFPNLLKALVKLSFTCALQMLLLRTVKDVNSVISNQKPTLRSLIMMVVTMMMRKIIHVPTFLDPCDPGSLYKKHPPPPQQGGYQNLMGEIFVNQIFGEWKKIFYLSSF